MGGENSKITDDVKTVLFEAACFNGTNIRKSAKRIGLRTDASGKFEKGLDPNNSVDAINRACQLIQELGCGEVVGGIVDVCAPLKERVRIPFEPERINALLGTQIPEAEMLDYFGRLEFEYDEAKKELIIPSFRQDIEGFADVAEEVARFYGYDKIPDRALSGVADGRYTDRQKLEKLVTDVMLSEGLSEVCTYTFISPKQYDKLRLPADSPRRDSVKIMNPLGEDTSIMRTTAVPSMLDVLSRNYNNRNPKAAMFEIAVSFKPRGTEELPKEPKNIVIGLYGEEYDYFTLKGVIEELLSKTGITDYDIERVTDDPILHPGRAARITVGGKTLALLGEVHPETAKNFSIGTRCYVAEVSMDVLLKTEARKRSILRFRNSRP